MVDYKAFRFFRDNAGYVVGRRAECALSLARAEAEAKEAGFSFDWEWDEDCDLDGINHDGWCRPDCGIDHEILGCIVRDEAGNVLGSLWGIVDPTPEYRRVIEAELAAEALHVERQALASMAL